MHDVKALLFDVFGTLVDWRTAIAREAEMLLGRASTWMGRHWPTPGARNTSRRWKRSGRAGCPS